MRRPRTSIASPETGAEIVELAFVISLLMMVMMGIVVFARAYNVYQTMTRAAREGVREAVLPTAASAGNNLSFIASDSTCPATSINTPDTPIFDSYIAPALRASSLNPNSVQNYSECVGPLDPGNSSDAYPQCGVKVSFQYPVQFKIPFTTGSLTQFNLSTSVQMRLENQPVSSSGGTTTFVCAGGS